MDPPARRRRDSPERERPGVVVEARWWYWVATLPVMAAFAVVTAAWVSVAVGADLGAPASLAVALTAATFAVPFAVVLLVFPLAVYRDASALRAAGAAWPVHPGRLALLAAATVPTGPAGSVPLACYYLYRRRAVAAMPF